MILPLYAVAGKLTLRCSSRVHLGSRPFHSGSYRHPCRCRCPAVASMLVFIPAVGDFVIPELSAARYTG